MPVLGNDKSKILTGYRLSCIIAGIGGKGKTMNNLFPTGNPDDPKSEAFKVAYALAKKEGDKRFGSECKHKAVKGGHCVNCLRLVVTNGGQS